jgi:hypothetical protein
MHDLRADMHDPRANKITSLDAAMTLWFHIVAHSRGASEFIRSAAT